MDDADRAKAQEQQWRDLTITAHTNRLKQPVVVTDICLNCGAKLPAPQPGKPAPRWCDAECRDDWEALQR